MLHTYQLLLYVDKTNFRIEKGYAANYATSGYDYESIMHYAKSDLAKEDGVITIEPIDKKCCNWWNDSDESGKVKRSEN